MERANQSKNQSAEGEAVVKAGTWYTITEAEKACGISRSAITNAIDSGKLSAVVRDVGTGSQGRPRHPKRHIEAGELERWRRSRAIEATPGWITLREASRVHGINDSRLYEAIKDGRLRAMLMRPAKPLHGRSHSATWHVIDNEMAEFAAERRRRLESPSAYERAAESGKNGSSGSEPKAPGKEPKRMFQEH